LGPRWSKNFLQAFFELFSSRAIQPYVALGCSPYSSRDEKTVIG
jgi:hypothetical protein